MEFTTATVKDDDDGIRLDRWFKRHQPTLPHAMLEKQLRKGDVRVDGKKAKSSDRIAVGQELRFPNTQLAPREKKQPPMLSEEDQRDLLSWGLYKDDQIIVINKPAGLAVQGGSKVTRCLDDMLYGLQFDLPQPPKLVHRIDRDTSGTLLLARTQKAAAHLAKSFASKTIEKTYWAIVCGCPLKSMGVIEAPLAKGPRASDGREQAVVDFEEGKHAVTEYRIIDSLARTYALMELKPITGRMHQLRAHMSLIEHPILGDHKYGGANTDAESLGVQNILHLHARHIHIPAWAGGKEINITAPLPPHMVATFRALGLDVPKDS